MVAYSFRRQFCEPIVERTKGGTIRNARRGYGHARPGDQLQLYFGMRTQNCRLIARETCLATMPIKLIFGSMPGVELDGFRIGIRFLDDFSRFDGFRDWDGLAAFWSETHDASIEYVGYHIRWLAWPPSITLVLPQAQKH